MLLSPGNGGPQRLEKIESAPGNGMVSEASDPQDLVRGRAADRAPLRLTSRNVGASPSLRDNAGSARLGSYNVAEKGA